MRSDAQVLKGHLEMLLLAALEDGPRHGYAVKEALRAGSGGRFDLPTGTIYPALHRLERAGSIDGSWSVVDGRRRRTYRLTPKGLRRLHAGRADWREFAAAITALVDPPSRPAGAMAGDAGRAVPGDLQPALAGDLFGRPVRDPERRRGQRNAGRPAPWPATG